MTDPLIIIGGGLAGAEAAWAAARAGCPVVIHEMRPERGTFAHRTGDLAEMVCSNSFRSDDDTENAVGLLHWELRQAGSLIMAMADAHRLPAGGALAVDRQAFSAAVTHALRGPAGDHRDRAADLGRFGRGDPGRNGRGCAGLLRRHRADRAFRLGRSRPGLVPVAL